MFKSLKVKNLLLGSCVIITFLMVILILFENNYLQKIYDNSNLFFVNQSSISELDELRDELDNMRTLNFALIGNYSMNKSVRQIEGDLEKTDQKIVSINKNLQKEVKYSKLWKNYLSDYSKWKELDQQFISEFNKYKGINFLESTETKESVISQLFEEFEQSEAAYQQAILSLNKVYSEYKKDNDQYFSDITENVSSHKGFLWGAAFLVSIIAIFFGMILIKYVTRPLNEISKMLKEITLGRFSRRLDILRKDEIGDISALLNNYADETQNYVISAMKKIANGNIDIDIKNRDENDEIVPALKEIISSAKGLDDETNIMIDAALNGNLKLRGDADRFKGVYRKILKDMNKTLDLVTEPVGNAIGVLNRVAEKDLSVKMSGEYFGDYADLKNAMNKSVKNLHDSIFQVAQTAEQVATASEQIRSGSEVIAQGASEQASSLEEVSSSLNEIASMTRQNTANARETNGLTQETRKGSEQGTDSMNQLSSAINKIKDSSDRTAKIVKTIDEIAFQTNLLALNAAVEAARAGEAGKGFAVVAEEVRNLAMRSAEAAKETELMINESIKNADEGVEINQQVIKQLEAVTKGIIRVNEVMTEIATASEQQSDGIDQVTTAVEQMNQVTQQNASNSEESSGAAEELGALAEKMRIMVAEFKIDHKDSVSNKMNFLEKKVENKVNKAEIKFQKPKDDKEHDMESVIPFNDNDSGNFNGGDDIILKQF